MKRLGVAVTLFVALTTTVCLRAQQPSFAGTWKLNLAESAFRADPFSREDFVRGAALRLSSSPTTDLSGKDFPTPDSGAASWKK
jgi:hypothetical protein